MRTEECPVKIIMKNIKEKIEEIFEEAMDKPGKFARLVLSADCSLFIRNDGVKFNILECLIATRKGKEPMVIKRINHKEANVQILAAIRKNKYIAYLELQGNKEQAEIFEVQRKDRVRDTSLFFALFHTDRGSICILCDNGYEDMQYVEFAEMSSEPCFYDAIVEMLKSIGEKEERKNGQET